ncbi:MAG: sulfotransferase [Pseudomonadota bacterium]
MVETETYSESTASARPVDFLVIGAMRAGTTSLHNTLSKLDGLSLPRMKETDFFIESKNWARGLDWYRGLFASRDSALRGEVCPNYAKRDVFPEVPGNVRALAPDVRLIYLVRDPVERALSHFRHTWISTGDVPSPDAFEGSWAERHILSTSQYAWQLEPWLDTFSADQVLVIDLETLICEPETQIAAIADHIGLDADIEVDHLITENAAVDVARMPRWWHAMRNTPVGIKARSMTPTGLVRAVKSRLRSRTVSEVPALPSSVRDRFAEILARDAQALRSLTGQSFARWSV